MATTSNNILEAARDNDLRERLVALAAQQGVDNPQAWVESRMWQLAATPVTDGGDTIASVYEYAAATYKPTPRPGEDSTKVTDTHLTTAVKKLHG